MRVLFIQKMAGISGSELYLLKLLPLLQAKGVHCTMLLVSNPAETHLNDKFIALLATFGVAHVTLETRSVLNPKILSRIYKIFKNGKFDLIHTHLIHADFWGASVKFLFDRSIKLVSTKHGYDEGFQAMFGYNPKHKRFDTYYLISLFAEQFINRSAAVSDGLRSFFVGMGISKPGKIETLVHGMDFTAEAAKEEPVNCRFFDKQIVIVGRLIPYKGQQFVIDCLPDLVKKFPDLGLVLVGSGSSENDLKERVKALNLESYVRFEGFRANVHSYLSQSDIVVVPSTSEGFGIVILEAWFHKKPVVAFDVPAPNTIIRNGKDGILVTPFDIRELGNKLADLLQNPDERQRIGQGGFDSLNSQFSESKMVEATINLYNKVLAEA